MKKRLVVAVIAAMLTFGVTACGDDGQASNDTTDAASLQEEAEPEWMTTEKAIETSHYFMGWVKGIPDIDYSNSETGGSTFIKGDEGGVSISEVAKYLDQVAKKQGYTEVDISQMTVKEFLDWFEPKFAFSQSVPTYDEPYDYYDKREPKQLESGSYWGIIDQGNVMYGLENYPILDLNKNYHWTMANTYKIDYDGKTYVILVLDLNSAE